MDPIERNTLIVLLGITIIIIIIGYGFYDLRYKKRENQKRSSLGGEFVRTNEVFTDPSDGKLYRVYYNPGTGEREYIEES